jgi:ankyrin repeat protein
MGRSFSGGFAAAIALSLLAVPAAAQQVSDGYAFLKAVRERDGNKVQDLIASGSVIINTRERDTGESALHIVVRERDLTWLSFLLGRGARPDLQNKNGDTPLGLSAQLSWAEGAQLLINRGASVDLPNNNGETPLILAVHKRDIGVVRVLLARGADPKKTDNIAGYSALDYAKRDARDAPLVKLLETPRAPARGVAGPKF